MTNQFTKPLVAIVDDDESIRVATESLLRSVRYRTVSFASAEEFLDTERLSEIECMILDVKLGGMDGLALQMQIGDSNLGIPIIFLSAHCTEKTQTEALKHGAVAVLRKPCSETALLGAINLALKTSGCR